MVKRDLGLNEMAMLAQAINDNPLLSAEDEEVLAKAIGSIVDRRQAETTFVLSNLRLVVKIAKRYRGKTASLALADLVHEGVFGLMKAAETFNPKRARFSTHAGWWIRRSIIQALDKSGNFVRVPVHVRERISKCQRAEQSLRESLQREPTDEEIAQQAGVSLEKFKNVREVSRVRKVKSLSDLSRARFGSRQGDFDPPDTSCNLSQGGKVDPKQDLPLLIRQSLQGLNTDEYNVIKFRFGLDNHPTLTLVKIGQELGLSRDSIERILDVAVRKLKADPDMTKALELLLSS